MKWIKLWIDESLNGTIVNELSATEKGIWFMLLLLGGKSLTLGTVEKTKTQPIPEAEMVDHYMKCDHDTYKKTLKKLSQLNMIQIQEDKRIRIVNWNCYQTFRPRVKKVAKKTTRISGDPIPGSTQTKMQRIFKTSWEQIRKTKYAARVDEAVEKSALRDIYGICVAKAPSEPLKFFENRTKALLEKFDIKDIPMLATYFDFDMTLTQKEE